MPLQSVQNNASLYLDAFVTQSGKSPVRGDPTYPGDGEVLHVRKPLTRYQTQRKVRAVKNLLTGKSDKENAEAEAAQLAEDEKEETEEERKARPIVSFYHPNVTLDLVVDSGAIELAKTPPPVRSRESELPHQTVTTPPELTRAPASSKTRHSHCPRRRQDVRQQASVFPHHLSERLLAPLVAHEPDQLDRVATASPRRDETDQPVQVPDPELVVGQLCQAE